MALARHFYGNRTAVLPRLYPWSITSVFPWCLYVYRSPNSVTFHSELHSAGRDHATTSDCTLWSTQFPCRWLVAPEMQPCCQGQKH